MSRNYSWAVQPSCNKADVTNYCVGEEEAKVKGAVKRERENRRTKKSKDCEGIAVIVCVAEQQMETGDCFIWGR